jgi:hypothetical protein
VGRASAWFLILFGVWTWFIWPNFLRNIWADERSWSDGPTSFFVIHLLLVVTSLVLGTGVAIIGVRARRARTSL